MRSSFTQGTCRRVGLVILQTEEDLKAAASVCPRPGGWCPFRCHTVLEEGVLLGWGSKGEQSWTSTVGE